MKTENKPSRHPELLRRIEEARGHMKYQGTGEWTDDQLLASYALCIVQKGYHHLGKIKADGRTGVVSSIYGNASTFDYDTLTRIVLVAHQMGVRMSVGSSGPRMIKLTAHARHSSDETEGELSFAERHPSLAHLASECERWAFKTEPT